MAKQVRETAAGKSLRVYVIMRGARQIATIHVHWSNGGTCTADLWHHDAKARERTNKALGLPESHYGPQQGRAGGYGYDKETAALRGMVIDGIALSDHCGQQKKPPRGLRYFPADYKPPRGYSLANHGRYWTETGERIESYHWRDKARAELGEESEWADVEARARALASEAEAAGEMVSGYSSCFRDSGLKYLEARGYNVIQAL